MLEAYLVDCSARNDVILTPVRRGIKAPSRNGHRNEHVGMNTSRHFYRYPFNFSELGPSTQIQTEIIPCEGRLDWCV